MQYTLHGDHYSVTLSVTDTGAWVEEGRFGQLRLCKTPLTRLLVRHLPDGHEAWIEADFGIVGSAQYGNTLRITLSEPMGIPDILLVVYGKADNDGIRWSVQVVNDSPDYSVLWVSYPMPRLTADHFDLFVPGTSGKVVKDADSRVHCLDGYYPCNTICMPYFAAYGDHDGIYVGIEDGCGATKHILSRTGDGSTTLRADYAAIGMTLPHNSFALSGVSHWQYLRGDWYDAAMVYKRFVYAHAQWMPPVGKNGREDTPERFRDIPFWAVGYIPNDPSQGNNMPMTLGIGTATQTENYWYESVIRLQEALEVPIAFHVYNWHRIPFNIEYPHFLPPRERFLRGLTELKKHDIAVMPYINAVSWETLDGEMGHVVNFENTGYEGAVLDEYGKRVTAPYPQHTVKGTTSQLAPMCPIFHRWHTIVSETAHRLMTEVDIDGIYFDEIASHPARTCCNPVHDHAPGGGSYWVEGDRLLMEKVRSRMTEDSFTFTECNAEPYMSAFDGLLTWTWVHNGEVPAFPAVYAGATQMIGRFNIGKKLHDFTYFKYATAKALLYGQQLGWITTNALEQPGWLDFLKIAVQARYRLSKVFSGSDMLRPPHVESDIPDVVTDAAGLWVENEDIVMEQVFGGAWQDRTNGRVVVMLINIAETEAHYRMDFDATEYGVGEAVTGFQRDGTRLRHQGTLSPHEFRTWFWAPESGEQ